MADRMVLEVRDIKKNFGGIQALKGVSFAATQGKVHALLGENGAGKSTLIKILTGVHQADSGTLMLDGEKVEIHSAMDAKRAGITAIYQELSLAESLSVAENIFLGNEPAGRYTGYIKRRELCQRGEAYLKRFGIELDVRCKVGQLGMGQKRIVEIVKALAANARILLLDEPTTGMSQAEIGIFFRILESLKEKQVTMIYISHYLDEVFQICDTATVLRDGEKAAEYKVAETSRNEIVRSMIGKELRQKQRRNNKELSDAREVLSLKSFKTRIMKEPVTVVVRETEVVGITGIVGAGKSELAQSIFGNAGYEAGEMRVKEQLVHFRSPYDSKRYKVAFLPEDRKTEGLFPQYSAAENMIIASPERTENKWGLTERRKKEKLTREMMEKLKVQPADPALAAGNFSGGNQQKIVLGKWLMTEPDVIILDEPTRGIDIGAKEEIHHLIRELAREGKAVMVMSSEFEELHRLCDRILVMYKGQIIKELRAETSTAGELLSYSLGGADNEEEQSGFNER